MEISYIFQILTLLVSICILVLNILFSRIEKSREYLLENITKQRNYDMLKMRGNMCFDGCGNNREKSVRSGLFRKVNP